MLSCTHCLKFNFLKYSYKVWHRVLRCQTLLFLALTLKKHKNLMTNME